MTENELKALKDLVASAELKSESDLNIGGCAVGGCSQCCSTTMGGM